MDYSCCAVVTLTLTLSLLASCLCVPLVCTWAKQEAQEWGLWWAMTTTLQQEASSSREEDAGEDEFFSTKHQVFKLYSCRTSCCLGLD